MDQPMPVRWSNTVRYFLGAAALACVALLGARVCFNLPFGSPLQTTTSGAEEEALFSVWTVTQGHTPFMDPHAIPYAASYFNWLFYTVYGAVAGGVLHGLHLGDAWLPTICRWLTLVFALLGCGGWAVALRVAGQKDRWPWLLILVIIAQLNPLGGHWLITTRPDVAATACELLGLACFFGYLKEGAGRWLLGTALALYAGWAFKQSTVSVLAGVLLTLLVLRRFRALVGLGGLWIIGVALTLWILGPVYRAELYLSQAHAGFSMIWGLRNLFSAVAKMPFIVVAVVAVAWELGRSLRDSRQDPVRLAIALTVLVSLGIEAVAACKGGASDNYFFTLASTSLLWIALTFPAAPARQGALVAASLWMIVAVGAVFMGWRGRVDCRAMDEPYRQLAAKLAKLPGPVFVEDKYGSLPWISPSSPHFVYEFNYADNLKAGVKYEHGGWEALIAQGYFATLVFDLEGRLEHVPKPGYREIDGDRNYRYFERVER